MEERLAEICETYRIFENEEERGERGNFTEKLLLINEMSDQRKEFQLV